MPVKVELDGIDACGKSRAIEIIEAELAAMGAKVIVLQESGFREIEACVTMRKLALDPHWDVSPITMELLFAAQRVENDRWIKNNAIAKACDIILCDRGYLSHLAYGFANVGLEQAAVVYRLFNEVLESIDKPDHILYMDVPPEVGATRIAKRKGATDKIEMLGTSHQEKVRGYFIGLLQKPSANLKDEGRGTVTMINTDQSLEKVDEQLICGPCVTVTQGNEQVFARKKNLILFSKVSLSFNQQRHVVDSRQQKWQDLASLGYQAGYNHRCGA